MSPLRVFVCGPDLEFEYGRQIGEAQQLEAELDADFAIEAAMGPWPSRDGWTEEVDVEHIPVHALDLAGLS